MNKFKPQSLDNPSDNLYVTDNSLPDLVSTPGPGSDSGGEESRGRHGQKVGRDSKEANLSRTPQRTGRMSQSIFEGDRTSEIEDNSPNDPPLSTQETSETDMQKEKPRTQTERMMEDILATRRTLLEGREPLNPRDKKTVSLPEWLI